MKKIILTLIVLPAMVFSCTPKEEESKNEVTSKGKFEQVKNFVDTISLKYSNFNKEIVCNGKLRAIEKSELSFATAGVVASINAFNGNDVKKGEVLAKLDTKEAIIDLEKAKEAMEKAHIDLLDKLIGQGYEADTTNVPAPILKNLKLTSGYNSALDQLQASERKLDNCFLYAPFSGKVANMDSKLHQRTADKFCTLIDDNYFDIEFNLLEAELGDVAKGQQVVVTPFIMPNNRYSGIITQINPVVDDKGQIKIRAKVQNKDGQLIEGMNVKVIIQNIVPDVFVVPKDAVVLRDGYSVIFRYEDGKAVWTYVEVIMSNIDSHAITGHTQKQTKISVDDIVITSGNLNLANATEVSPKASKKTEKK